MFGGAQNRPMTDTPQPLALPPSAEWAEEPLFDYALERMSTTAQPHPSPHPAWATGAAPLAVDLFCGRGGWTVGLAAHGYEVVGVDLLPQPAYPTSCTCSFVQADLRTLRAHELHLPRRPHLVVASPPCQGFSTIRPDRQSPPPVQSFELVAHALRLIAELRPTFWAVENVRGAWKWWAPLLGDPDIRANPYYLWGNLPTAFRPAGKYPSKLRYRDAGRRSVIPAALAAGLAASCLCEPPPARTAGLAGASDVGGVDG